jgi:hypothetical protein
MPHLKLLRMDIPEPVDIQIPADALRSLLLAADSSLHTAAILEENRALKLKSRKFEQIWYNGNFQWP